MKYIELAKACGKRNIECDGCPYYMKECKTFAMELDGISPYGIIMLLEKNIEELEQNISHRKFCG